MSGSIICSMEFKKKLDLRTEDEPSVAIKWDEIIAETVIAVQCGIYPFKAVDFPRKTVNGTKYLCSHIAVFFNPHPCTISPLCDEPHRTPKEIAERHALAANRVHCSHLCQNARCVNPKHLILEMDTANYERTKCQEAGICCCGNANYPCFVERRLTHI